MNSVNHKNTNCYLSTAYIPPIQYMIKFMLYKCAQIEKHEHYSKQSYRNRCIIYSANGPLTLSIPTKKEQNLKINIQHVKIDYSDNWPKDHLRGIESAYRHSPFFDYYYDDIRLLIDKRYEFLIELNTKILDKVLEWLDLTANYKFTNDFAPNYPSSDYRDSIHPKKRMNKPDKIFKPAFYKQVFSEKYGFVENLSILDLIFNKGPESYQIMQQSIMV